MLAILFVTALGAGIYFAWRKDDPIYGLYAGVAFVIASAMVSLIILKAVLS